MIIMFEVTRMKIPSECFPIHPNAQVERLQP